MRLYVVWTRKKLISNSFTIDLGGVIVSYNTNTHDVNIKPAHKYSRFITDQPPETIFTVYFQEYQGNLLGISSFYAKNWVIHRSSEFFVINFGTTDMPEGKYAYTVVIKPGGTDGEIYLNQRYISRDYSSIEIPPSMLDEVMAAQLLAHHNGLLFHACGIQVNPETGFLFAGTSGSGKTTTARLWHEYSSSILMSDERLAVRKQGGSFYIHSTPWHSPEFSTSCLQAPLSRVFILKHDMVNRVRRLEITEAVSLLLPRAYLPSWDSKGMEKTLEYLEQLCTSVPCYEFGFTPDQNAVQFIQCLKD